jgi:hypothetical protein
VERFTRPFTEQEKKKLSSRKFSVWKHFENFGMKWVFASLILLSAFLLVKKFVMDISSEIELPIIIIVELIAIAVVIYIMKRTGELNWNKKIESELRDGDAEVIRIKTDRVVKRKDPEDFGSGFYIKLDEKSTLYLEGQYLDELQYSRKFPNTEFEIIRTKWLKELLEINSLGKYLKPERKLKPFTKEQYKTGNRPFDGDIIELPIDEIK